MPPFDRTPPWDAAPPLPAELAHPAGPATCEELEALRAKLDRIDESLLNGLRDRLACSVEMADVRRRIGMPGLDPGRAGVIQRRTARFAAENGIDEDFLRRVYHLIMEESRRLQDAASGVRR
jgi:chorismate mutase